MRHGKIGKSTAFLGLGKIDHDVDLTGPELIKELPKGTDTDHIFETCFQSDFAPELHGKSVRIAIRLSNGERRIILFAADNERTMRRSILCEQIAGKENQSENGTEP